MSTRLACVAFDAVRPRAVARFWARLLGWEVAVDRPDRIEVAAPDPDAPDVALTFLPATRPKSGKNRIHLDLAARSPDHQRLQVDRALALGARPVDIGQGAAPWTVLADPDGNEFCVLEPREEYLGTGAVAAIVVETHDPTRLARFWSTAVGWPIVHDKADSAGIRSATEQGPWVEFVRSRTDSGARGRVHLELASFSTDDPAEDLARLRAAGATAVRPHASHSVDTAHAVLSDPETYEFRLLRARAD
ncbi:VOC family protein [Nocardia transvalensis]|uniref:VOC family protein n=1 Tax=Nocardia transvalensis TaxID=37333 RepID=UPI00189636EF|nr:VOC family protein [Nocardia transvalensis]MBF6327088.1 VOC family protein [Nocardia transvalensis]